MTPEKPFDLTHLTASELHTLYSESAISPIEVVDAHLDRIAESEPALQAFISIRADDARREAAEAAERWRRGAHLGPLDGVPVSVKDLMAVSGLQMTGGSARPWPRATTDAHAVGRLRRAGAIVLGTNTLHEYAFGGTSVNAHTGTPRNPRSLSCIAGGSSGGSAAAVAAGLAVGALGTETGNSIRRPAAFCGVVGFKPTWGRISRSGVVPLAPSLDHVGVLTRSVPDAALFVDEISGHDPSDAGTSRRRLEPTREIPQVEGLRIGVPWSMLTNIGHDIADAFDDALVTLASKGATIAECALPIASRWTAIASSVIMHAEAATVHADRFRDSAESYGDDVAARIVSGQAFSGADLSRASWIRTLISTELDEAFGPVGRFDAIVAPAVPATAPPLAPGAFVPGDAPWSTEVGPFHLQRLPSLIGIPAGSVPVGWSNSSMPLPLMAMAAKWDDPTVLAVLNATSAPIPVAYVRRPHHV